MIALDDFGTGYSSLSYVQRFPFSTVKIDRSVVARLGQGGNNDVIVAAVIDLCNRLRMVTTGEGVETVAQLGRSGLVRILLTKTGLRSGRARIKKKFKDI